jgi:hypothetical protein
MNTLLAWKDGVINLCFRPNACCVIVMTFASEQAKIVENAQTYWTEHSWCTAVLLGSMASDPGKVLNISFDALLLFFDVSRVYLIRGFSFRKSSDVVYMISFCFML